MCNRYHPSGPDKLPGLFDKPIYGPAYAPAIGPRQDGPYMLNDRFQVGQWGLIPSHAKERHPKGADGRVLMTNNCRSETMATRDSFKGAWAAGQRCLIPADLFLEPYWGPADEPFKKTVWWAFERADGLPWMIAGLWNEWTDFKTGEVVPSYTMVTMNADDHPLMRLMHRPDPKRPATKQDKRSVVPLLEPAYDIWLNGTNEQAFAALRLPPLEVYKHHPEDPAKEVALPL